jgi:hypothetical protein
MKRFTITALAALVALGAVLAFGPAPARASRIVVVWNNTAHCAMIMIHNPVGSPNLTYHLLAPRLSYGQELYGTVKVRAEILPGAACSGGRIADVEATHPMNYRNPETAHALTAEISGRDRSFSIKYF